MHPIFGVLMIAMGLFMMISALVKSEFIVYRLMAARAKIMWGENVHRFLSIAGVIIIIVGSLATLGIIW